MKPKLAPLVILFGLLCICKTGRSEHQQTLPPEAKQAIEQVEAMQKAGDAFEKVMTWKNPSTTDLANAYPQFNQELKSLQDELDSWRDNPTNNVQALQRIAFVSTQIRTLQQLAQGAAEQLQDGTLKTAYLSMSAQMPGRYSTIRDPANDFRNNRQIPPITR